MTTQAVNLPILGIMAGFRRFSVMEYHNLILLEVLTEDDNVELLDGYLVHKLPRSSPHEAAVQEAVKRLLRLLPAEWDLRAQSAVTLPESEPEPDLAIIRGDEDGYATRHPAAADVALVIEVADSSLPADRIDRCRIYAEAGIVCYWIVNLNDRQIEVYTAPSGPTGSPGYGQRVDYRAADQLPLVLDGATVAVIAVEDLLP